MSDLSFTQRITNFKPYIDHVINWNGIFRNHVHSFDEATIAFQKSLVKEELDELAEAIAKNDRVEALDALIDIFVTCSYWAFLENEQIPSADVSDFIVGNSLNFEDLHNAHKYGKPNMLLVMTCDLLYNFDGALHKSMMEVLNSNDSKFPQVIEVDGLKVFMVDGLEFDPQEECKMIELRSKSRYTGVTYKIVKDGDEERFVFFSDKGKILKPCTFKEPNLKQYI